MRNALGAALLVMAAALPSSAMAEDEQAPEPPRIYECTGADGAVVYQDDPCPAPPPVPAKPSAKPSPRAKPAATAAKRTAPPPVPAPSPAAPPPRAAKRPGDDEWARI
ncbi:MAG TPA: hypothetical protein VFB67_06460, partial [Candidatus Polarisedimenticolaceae bacterium]|nr:hypothetical protein [Candidatus Polarisedimenticolaceae bacterium]